MTTQNTKLECPKCSGHGKLPEFDHIANGVCFFCEGKGNVGEVTPAELSKILKGAEKHAFDDKHAPYYVTAEFWDDNYPVRFYDLAKAAEFCVDARKTPKENGRVALCHRDGTLVTRGEVRAAS